MRAVRTLPGQKISVILNHHSFMVLSKINIVFFIIKRRENWNNKITPSLKLQCHVFVGSMSYWKLFFKFWAICKVHSNMQHDTVYTYICVHKYISTIHYVFTDIIPFDEINRPFHKNSLYAVHNVTSAVQVVCALENFKKRRCLM